MAHPRCLPILSLTGAAVLDERSNSRHMGYRDELPGYLGSRAIGQPWPESASYAPGLDGVSLRYGALPREVVLHGGVWPGGTANVSLTGVFGWLDEGSLKSVSTTLTAELNANSTTVTVASAALLRPRDVLVVGGIALILSSVNTGTGVCGIDPPGDLLPAALPNGTVAKSWGAVPLEVELYVTQLCAREVARRAWRAGNSPGDVSLLRYVKVDGFEAGFNAPNGGGGSSSSSASSGLMLGIPELDSMLQAFLESGGAALLA